MANLTPEQQASAALCDRLTNAILNSTEGVPVGVVVGACLNVLDTASQYCVPNDRKLIAARMRHNADLMEANEAMPMAEMPETPQ